MKLLALLLLMSSGLTAANAVLAYDFENGVTSEIGIDAVIVGAGPSFVTFTPQPLSGSYSANTFTDANHLTFGAGAFTGITDEGTIEFSMMLTRGSSLGNAPLALVGTFAGGNFFWQLNADTTFNIRMPTSGGNHQVNSIARPVSSLGQWLRYRFSWSGTNYQVWSMNPAAGVWNRFVSGTAPATITFASCTIFAIGSAAEQAAPGLALGAGNYLDSLVIYDGQLTNELTDTLTYHPQYVLEILGASWSAGRGVGGSCNTVCGEGWRTSFRGSRIVNNVNAYFSGASTCSTTPLDSAFDAAPSRKAADVLAAVNASVRLAFLTYTAKNYVLLGSDFCFNDASNATNLTTFRTQTDAIFVSITAVSANIKPYLILYPAWDFTDPTAYMDEAVASANAAGIPVIDLTGVPFVDCGDTTHPDQDTYDAFGPLIYDGIFAEEASGDNRRGMKLSNFLKGMKL